MFYVLQHLLDRKFLTVCSFSGEGGWGASLAHFYTRRVDVVNRGCTHISMSSNSFILQLNALVFHIFEMSILYMHNQSSCRMSLDNAIKRKPYSPDVQFQAHVKSILCHGQVMEATTQTGSCSF
jgi:hypothetical protein